MRDLDAIRRPAARGLRLLALLLALALPALADDRETCERKYQPRTGQAGKDVVWMPTSDALVERMLEIAKVTPADLVYDLGAGDGKIAIAAAKRFGARAVGVEYDPELANLAQCLAAAERVADKVRIVQGDIFTTDFSEATVVTLYLLPELNLRLRPTLLKMRPGTRVVSHSFLMGAWQPDERTISGAGYAYLWIVPADVAGSWMFEQPGGEDAFAVHLEQTFQEVRGTIGEHGERIAGAGLRGAQLTLVFSRGGKPATLVGRVDGERIEARLTRGSRATSYAGTRQ